MGFRRTPFTIVKILMMINTVVDRYLATGTSKELVNYEMEGKTGLKKDNRITSP